MAINQKFVELVKLLYEKTKSGDVVWEKTTDSTTFLTSFPSYSVILTSSSGQPNLTIYNQENELLEKLTYREAVSVAFSPQLEDMYDRARRQAFGVDEALDKLLEELKTQPTKTDKR